MGGYEPVNGPGTDQVLAATGYVFYWITFNTGECGGSQQVSLETRFKGLLICR